MDKFFETKRIGYACKWMNDKPTEDKKVDAERVAKYNFKGTTVKHMKTLSNSDAIEKVYNIIEHNCKALELQITWLGIQDISLSMLRIGSDFWPFYTEENFSWMYKEDIIKKLLEKRMPYLGDLLRFTRIRPSMHPGQFCILNSANPKVVDNSVAEFEYHCEIMRMMGFSGWHPYGMEINVHGGSKKEGLEPLINVIQNRLSEDARNWISIENDEYSFSITDLHRLSDICAILLDIHHHFINSKGEYIQPDDERVKPFISSWRGVIPELHYSISPEYVLEGKSNNMLPDFNALLTEGFSRTDLRKHSDGAFNSATNDWVLSFLEDFDIMVEAKHKNLASNQLLQYGINNNINLSRIR